MPRVPTYDTNVVPLARTTTARFAPPGSSGRSGLGEGLQQLSASLSDRANTLTKIEEQEGEREARQLDVAFQAKASEIRRRVRQTRGSETASAVEAANAELLAARGDLSSAVKNPYAKKMLPDILDRRIIQEQDNFGEYAIGQARVADDAASLARSEASIDTALDFDLGSQAAADNMTTGLGEVAKLYGYQGADMVAAKQAEYRSRYHSSRVSQLFSGEKPEEAQSYIDTHRGDMTAADEASARSLIRGELLANRDASDVAMIVGSAAPPDASGNEPPPPPGEARWRPPIRQHTVTVKGGEPAAPRSYGGHSGRDYAGVPQGTPVYPMAEGVVRKVYRSGGGGNTVEIEYPGGYRSTYKHLADGSTASLKVGQTVDADDAVGSVGNTGTASRGAHLHAELLSPDGKRVDPSKMAGKSAPAPPPPDGRRVDLPSMYQRIDAQPWSESRKRRVKDSVQRYATENDQVLARSQYDAEQAITQSLVEIERSGGKLTKLSQLPAEALKNASPSFMLRLQDNITANNKPTAPDAHGDIAISLKLIAATKPEEFKNMNLVPLRPLMTPGEFESLAIDQAKIRNAPADVPATASIRAEMDTAIRFYGKEIGLDIGDRSSEKDRKQYSRISEMMRAYLDRATGGKRAPTDDEMKAAFDNATMEVTVRGGSWFGGDTKRRAFDVDPEAGKPLGAVPMPADVAARIRTTFQQARGRAPTNDELITMYLQNKGKPGFWR